MLSKKHQIQYCDKAWHRLEKQFQKFCDTRDLEALHKLRLEIKKIDSFIFLCSKCDPGKKLAIHLKPIKKLFKHAGLIRSANLNLKLTEKHNLCIPGYHESQHRIIASQIVEFRTQRKLYSAKFKKSYQKIIEKLTKIDDKRLTNIYLHEYKKTRRFMLKKNYGDKLHNYRRKMKFLIYTYNLLKRSVRNKLLLDMSFLDTLQNTIGVWHDYVSAIELLAADSQDSSQTIKVLEEQIQNTMLTIHSISNGFDPRKFK